jgi:PKHD-type hydroxylase
MVVSFPPSSGGLSSEQVTRILGAMDEGLMHQGRITAPGARGLNAQIRSGRVQWISHTTIGPEIFSHLFTLGVVASEERGWGFELAGIAHALQGVRYSSEGGQHYDWHVDWGVGNAMYRKLTAVVHLSPEDEFTGGHLQIATGSRPLDAHQEAGTVTVFPTFMLHRVTPVTGGCRSAAVAWILGPSFR